MKKIFPRNHDSVQFASFELVNMLNDDGAVEWVEADEDENKKMKVKVKGCVEMKAFTFEKQNTCKINGECVKSS